MTEGQFQKQAEQFTHAREDGHSVGYSVYPFSESFPGNKGNPVMGDWALGAPTNCFVSVWNEGTMSYERTRKDGVTLKDLVDQLPWKELMDEHLRNSAKSDQKRGNVQVSFGFSSGQSCKKRTPERITKDFGAAMPSERVGTRSPLIQRTIAVLSKILNFVEVAWTNPDFLSRNSSVRQRSAVFAETLGCNFEVGTIVFLRLSSGSAIKKHTDGSNCDELTQVLVVKRVVQDWDGNLWIMGFVCNQRRCCKEALVRRSVGADVSRAVVDFLNKADRYRGPEITVGDHYNYGAGCKGIFLSCDKTTRTITSVAMLSQAAMDKNRFFYSAIVSAIASFSKDVDDFTLQDGVGICACLTLLCNTEILVNALLSGDLAARWPERKLHVGGVCGLIIAIGTERNGAMNNGSHTRRCQPFRCADVLDFGKINDVVTKATDLCRSSKTKSYQGQDIGKLYDATATQLQRIFSPNTNGLNLCIQAFVHVMVMCKFLEPMELCHYARISATNSNSKKMADLDRSKNQVHQEQLRLYLSQLLGRGVTHAELENIVCECYRSSVCVDCVFPGQSFYELTQRNGRSSLLELVPRWEDVLQRFDAGSVGVFQGVKVDDWNTDCDLVSGKIPVKLNTGGTQEQFLLTRENVGPVILRQIKELMCRPLEPGDTASSYQKRICAVIEGFPEVTAVINKTQPRQRDADNWLQLDCQWERDEVTWAKAKVPIKCDNDDQDGKTGLCETEMDIAADELLEHPLIDFDEEVEIVEPLTQIRKKSRCDEEVEIIEPFTQLRKKSRWDTVTPPRQQSIRDVFRSISASMTARRTGTATAQAPVREATAQGPVREAEALALVPFAPPPARAPCQRKALTRECTVASLENPSVWQKPPQNKELPGSPNRGVASGMPTFLDSDGLRKSLDWSNENIARISKQVWVGESRVCMFPTSDSFDKVAGEGFNGFVGSRDMFDLPCVTTYTLPTLLDEAKNAVNSARQDLGRMPIEGSFRKCDYSWQARSYDRKLYHTFICFKMEGVDFSCVGQCLLCDKIAELLEGRKVPCQAAYVWGFQDRNLARQHFMLCAILTSGSSYHLRHLHGRARKWYHGGMQRAREIHGSVPKTNQAETHYVVAFNAPGSPVPFFYVIGNLNCPPPTQHNFLRNPGVCDDFCIVVPDRGFYRKHYAPGSRKPTKKDVKGTALYYRLVHSEEQLFAPTADVEPLGII